MNDDVKAALESLQREMADGDPDWWERERLIFAHIDGEPARIAAACEETREACARHIWAMSRRPTAEELMEMVGFARSTPLTATPLADALRLANETVVKLAQAATEAQARAEEGVRYWTDLAQAEARDAAALRARVAELEAQRASSQRHMNGRESYWVEQRTKWIAECDRIGESCKWHAARAEKAEAERDALRAQVEAARAMCERILDSMCSAEYRYAADHVLAAMDEAKP